MWLSLVASCGNTDLTATKAEANKALERKNIILKINKNNCDWTA